jgi:lactate dehydrogenase-like 2-hydroxyacid dehydrogenase
MRGKTAGMLGYGHIARETARLLKAFGVEVVAANTKGVRAADEGVSFCLSSEEGVVCFAVWYSVARYGRIWQGVCHK